MKGCTMEWDCEYQLSLCLVSAVTRTAEGRNGKRVSLLFVFKGGTKGEAECHANLEQGYERGAI